VALTEEGICNLALVRIGQRGLIDDLNEDTVEAQTAKAIYAPARDAVLASFWWQFATFRAALAEVSGASVDGWEYVYAPPASLLAPQYIWSGARRPSREAMIPFALEGDDTYGRLVYSDEPDAVLVYTKLVTEPAFFPPHFVQALAWKLASEFALGLPIKVQAGLGMDQKYEAALRTAIATDLRGQQVDPQPDGETIAVRS
jgi:hypothetical protein